MYSHPLQKNTWNIADYCTVRAVKKKSTFFSTSVTCNLSRTKKKKNKQRTIFVYFDIEAQQDTGNHVANLVCAEIDQNDTQLTFEGKDCVPDFIQWVHLLANQEDVEKVIVVAHNFKGYDGYFILDELYKQHTSHI